MKTVGHVVLSLMFLLVGIGLAWAAKYWVTEDPTTSVGDVVLISILVMPILLYSIISGGLKELKGPGGLELAFNSVAYSPVRKDAEHDPVSIDEDSQLLNTGSLDTLKTITKNFNESRPIYLSLTLGKGDYEPDALQKYVNWLYQYRTFELVVFLNDNGQFVAHMPAWAVKNLLDDRSKREDFVELIRNGREDLLDKCPGVVRASISVESTNAQTLEMMVEHNTNALVVVDKNRQLRGIADRGQVLGKMMLALANK